MSKLIACQKALFDIPDEVTYLNCGYMSPLLNSVAKAGEAGVARKKHPWKTTPPDFFSEGDAVRALFANLIKATPDDIALIPSVSYGMAVAAANLKLSAGQKIIMLDEQFPSNVYIWRELAAAKGASVVHVKLPPSGSWTEAVLDAIDLNTGIVALPNCHWTDGRLVDLVKVGKRCRAVGAALAIDATQSLGALDFSVKKVKPDFLAVAAYKWLLCPYSTGFLYVSPKHQGGVALEHSWMNRRDAADFAGLVNYRDQFGEGARRFDMGEHSNFTLMPMVKAALEQLTAWTIPAIGDSIGRLTKLIGERGVELGLGVADEKLRTPHMIGLRLHDGVPVGLVEKLAASNIYVSVRGDSIRVAPHLYNNENDVDRLFEVIKPLLAGQE